MVLALVAAGAAFFQLQSQGALTHRWTFNDGTSLDSVGPAHGTLYGTATITNGALKLSGSSGVNRMETAAFGRALTNKTLVAWCTLDNPAVMYKGSVLTTKEGGLFDGIVYAERTTNQWMNGSDSFRRTPAANNGGWAETSADPEPIMMTITYDQDLPSSAIKLYRNGTLYAQVTPANPVTNVTAAATAVIGPRNSTAEDPPGWINGSVTEARIYGKALTAFEVAALFAQGPDPAGGVWGQPVSGGWDRGANWLGALVPSGAGATADFSTLDISTDTSVSLNGPRTAGKVTFADLSASHDWYLSPGTNGALTLAAVNGVPEIAVSNRTATVALPLAGTNGFVKTGAGTLTLAATNGYQGATVVSAGTLRLGTTLAHRWSFDDGTANDSIGAAHGTLYGTASVSGGKLRLSGSSGNNRMETVAFNHTLGPDKTLVSWCTLDNPAVRYNGSVLSVVDGAAFDGIVYAENATNQWRNGSDHWKRTAGSGADETLADPNEIMMAITYESGAANRIKLYRNGSLYMQYNPNNNNPLTNFTATTKALIGPRWITTDGGYINGTVNEARVYRSALTEEQIAAMAAAGPAYTAPSDLLPTGTVVSVASGATLDLGGLNQTVAGLAGSGTVTNSASFTVAGSLAPGDTSAAPAVLTVSSNLTLAAGAAVVCDHNAVAADTVSVTGTLTVQGANTVQLSAIGAATPPDRFTLFTFGALTGAEHLANWTVQGNGLAGKEARVRSDATSVYVTINPRGTMIRVL
jgi:autotransporter-associated beta strand protein